MSSSRYSVLSACHISRETTSRTRLVPSRALSTQAVTDETRELQKDVGAPDTPTAADSSGATLVGRFGARSAVREGKAVEVAVDTRALHFFDPETGLGIYEEDTTKGAGS